MIADREVATVDDGEDKLEGILSDMDEPAEN